MDQAAEARLTRAGLTDDQILAVFEEYDNLDPEGKAEWQRWLDSVSDNDIQERYGDGQAAAPEAPSEGDSGSFGGDSYST